MQTRRRILARNFAFTLAAVVLPGAAGAQAQTVIDHLPYTITTSNSYVLNSNLDSSQTIGSVITVEASNVTVDFQGHYIAGPVGNISQNTIGIYARERSNITVKNGTSAFRL